MNTEEKNRAAEQRQEQLDTAMRQVLSHEAKTRLGNVKLVNQELYLKAAQAVLYLYQKGQVQGKINEEQLKQLLEKLSAKREIKIKRK